MRSLEEQIAAADKSAQSLSTLINDLFHLVIMAVLLVGQVVYLGLALAAVLLLSPVLVMTPALERASRYMQSKMR